jgi:hypothetical protein
MSRSDGRLELRHGLSISLDDAVTRDVTPMPDNMPASAPDIRDAGLTRATEDQAVQCGVPTTVAEPLVVIVDGKQVCPEPSFDFT